MVTPPNSSSRQSPTPFALQVRAHARQVSRVVMLAQGRRADLDPGYGQDRRERIFDVLDLDQRKPQGPGSEIRTYRVCSREERLARDVRMPRVTLVFASGVL